VQLYLKTRKVSRRSCQNIHSKGLQSFFNHNQSFQHYVKLLYGMAFVPPVFVEEAFEIVVRPYLESKSGQTAILVRWSAAQRTTEMLADQRTGKNSGPAPADYRN
jgi:hypothetical protein